MKFFLIVSRCLNPKQTYREYPLGAGMIATSMRRLGHEVVLHDQTAEGTDDDQVVDLVRDSACDVAGFSVITPSYPVAQRQIRRLRIRLPELPIVVGGIHANLFPQDLLGDGADAVVLGQGQEAMGLLMDRLGNRRTWSDVPGLVFRDDHGGVVQTPPRAPDAPVNHAQDHDPDVVDRDVYNLSRYTHHSMLASLGCPFRCMFCCNFSSVLLQGGLRVRAVDRVIQEIQHLHERYGASEVFFADDVFLLTRQSILAFCQRLRNLELPLQWVAQMRVDVMDAEVAEAMVSAGCHRVYFGVESGSDAILQRAGKGLDRQAIRRGIAAAKAAGMRVKTGWIVGLPGSIAEQYETVSFIRELRPHEVSIHQLIPFPGTEYYRNPAAHGVRIRDPKDFASFCFGGLSDNISFDYLPAGDLLELLRYTQESLESEGYVSSDRAKGTEQYLYSTPQNAVSMKVFGGNGQR